VIVETKAALTGITSRCERPHWSLWTGSTRKASYSRHGSQDANTGLRRWRFLLGPFQDESAAPRPRLAPATTIPEM